MSERSPLRFSVCIETIFTGMPFEQRLEHIADMGFQSFEFVTRQGKDMNITQALSSLLRLTVSAFQGSVASLVDPSQRPQLLNDITRAASLAVDLSCAHLIVHSGPEVPGISHREQRAHLIEGLWQASEIAADADVTLVLEPLNLVDHPGEYLHSFDEGFQIIREINDPHVRLLFDVYHQHMSGGDPLAQLRNHLDLIGYIQIADAPGRHEPGTGDINFAPIFKLLRERAYPGYIGLEYTPLIDSAASLNAVLAMSQR